MGGHVSKTWELQNPRDDEKYARGLLASRDLYVNEDSIHWILNHIDCFVTQSRGNKSVENVHLCLHASIDGQNDEVWYKLGQAIGNLRSLKMLGFNTRHYDDDQVLPNPDWGEVACILSRVRQKVEIELYCFDRWDVGEAQALARVIRGHPTITSFKGGNSLSYESLDSFYSALATLPALESIVLSSGEPQTRVEDESALAKPESLTELLRVPSLRSVSFSKFHFTPALCQATANALMEGTAITKLEFRGCSFSAGDCAAIIATALIRNSSVLSISVCRRHARVLFDALAAAIPSNSTLRHLDLGKPDNDDSDCLSTLLLALGKNTGIKTLSVDVGNSMDESLCTAIKEGLGTNATLESLELNLVYLHKDPTALWCRAFSFLRTNKTLKSLIVSFDKYVTDCAFPIDVAAMLQGDVSLESLSFHRIFTGDMTMEAEGYIALVTALQHNTRLRVLALFDRSGSFRFTDDEEKQMAALLKKNYALESLPDISQGMRATDLGTILRLNEAGRRYLIEDGSSISKGVDMLSRVHNDINCVYLHLLENPRLCDRSAVEIKSTDESNGRSKSPTASKFGGKREQASADKGKESRRRLA
jgi:hypothetical protein